jgi:GT2 family glycosyltransferase
VQSTPTASIVIPTRARPEYLEVALASVVPQAAQAGAEIIVVADGLEPATEEVARRHGARLVAHERPRGLNAARNTAVRAALGDPIAFLDDDVRVQPNWLDALLRGVRDAPEYDVFGGPIRAELEGGGPRACGREPAPITTLDLGPADCDAELVWGANMAIRRGAVPRAGDFDEALTGRGDEEEWERRYTRAGGRIRYLAGAEVVHRRTQEDSRLRSLSRAAYALGRTARRNDTRKDEAPPLRRELRVLCGCLWHILRRGCTYGMIMAAHELGRLRELGAEPRS